MSLATGPSRRVVVVASPGAGRAEAALATSAEAARRGHDVSDLVGLDLDTTRRELADLVSAGVDRVIACGGDGLVQDVATIVAGSDTILGVVPVGTGNDFARALPLPKSHNERVEVAIDAPGRSIDAIQCGPVTAVSVATTGFTHDVSSRAETMTWPRGQAVYAAATLRELPRLKTRTATLEIDGARFDLRYSLIAVCNTAWFGGGMHVCPGADPTDGLLDLLAIDGVDRRTFAKVFPRVFTGSHIHHPAIRHWRCRQVVIRRHDPVDIWADGERLANDVASCEAVPEALRIAVSSGSRFRS